MAECSMDGYQRYAVRCCEDGVAGIWESVRVFDNINQGF